MTSKGGIVADAADVEDLRDWAKLDARWYEDPRIELAADECQASFQMWPVLIGMAKAESSAKRNPDGVIRITPRKLAYACRCEVAETGPALQALERQGLISCTAEGNQCLSISLVGFARWQKPRGSAADRKQRSRELKKLRESRENAPGGHTMSQGGHTMSHDCDNVSQGCEKGSLDKTRLDKTRQDETRHHTTPKNETPLDQTARGAISNAELGEAPADDASDVSLYLPAAIQQACETAGVTGIRPEWWQSSIQKLRLRYASLPDEAFVSALDWIVVEADGSMLPTQRAWAMLRGSVNSKAAKHRELAEKGARASTTAAVGVDAAVLYWVEEQIGRELTSDEDHALQTGELAVEAFLEANGVGVSS